LLEALLNSSSLEQKVIDVCKQSVETFLDDSPDDSVVYAIVAMGEDVSE